MGVENCMMKLTPLPGWEKFSKVPCPEGAWIVKNKNKYYLQYATPGTICNWYCDVVLESDSVNGGFVEQPYNPVSLKVGGFLSEEPDIVVYLKTNTKIGGKSPPCG